MLERIESALSGSHSEYVSSVCKRHMTHPFTIDSHFRLRINAQTFNFLDVLDMFHIRRITSSPKNDGNLRSGIDIMRGDECPRCVIDQGC